VVPVQCLFSLRRYALSSKNASIVKIGSVREIKVIVVS
jgi:hypothetical protein